MAGLDRKGIEAGKRNAVGQPQSDRQLCLLYCLWLADELDKPADTQWAMPSPAGTRRL